MLVTNLIIAAFVLVETSGDWTAIGDQGRALGGLQIHEIMVRHYNQATGARLKHTDARDPRTAARIASWYFGHCRARYGRALTVAELYQCWNAGPDALARRQSVARGRRAQEVYFKLCAKEADKLYLTFLRAQGNILETSGKKNKTKGIRS